MAFLFDFVIGVTCCIGWRMRSMGCPVFFVPSCRAMFAMASASGPKRRRIRHKQPAQLPSPDVENDTNLAKRCSAHGSVAGSVSLAAFEDLKAMYLFLPYRPRIQQRQVLTRRYREACSPGRIGRPYVRGASFSSRDVCSCKCEA